MTPMKQLAGFFIIIAAFWLSGCSSGVESGFFSDYGLKEDDVVRVEITGFENTTWKEGQLYKKAALDTGTTMQLSLVSYDTEGIVNKSLKVSWSTSDAKVVLVDNKGKITAVSAGDALVTAELTTTDAVITDTIDITVLPSPVTGKQWTLKTTYLPQVVWDHASVIWNDHLYVAGGNSSCTALSNQDCGFTDKVNFAPINTTDRSVGTFINTTPLPVYLRGHSMLAYNGYLYAIGGIVQPTFPEPPYPDPAKFETMLNEKVYYAKVNSDGSLGEWKIAALLPSPDEDRDPPVAPDKTGLFALSASVHTALLTNGTKKGYIYITGGWSAEFKKNVNRVIIGPINDSDGKIESWIHNDLSDLPYDLSKHTSVVASINGSSYIYVIGGNGGNYGSQVFHHEILYAKIAEDGILSQTEKNGTLSTWHFASRSLPFQLIDHASLSIGRYVFVLGGRDGVDTSDDKEGYNKAKEIISFYIEDGGDLQLLERYVDLPEPLFHHAVAADNNVTDSINIYVTGGVSGNTADPVNRKNTVYHFSSSP